MLIQALFAFVFILLNTFVYRNRNSIQWYRKWVGGTWYYVYFEPVPMMSGWWTKTYPTNPNEVVIKTENY